MSGAKYRRRVGTLRPSHLMFTGGVGALVDLPNFSALVRGLDDWNFDALPEFRPISEPRMLEAARAALRHRGLSQLRSAPWLDDNGGNPAAAHLVGVPVMPFPQWLRCTACNIVQPVESGVFDFVNAKASRPDEAKFIHGCGKGRPKLAVPARFIVVCPQGHLDDFPYREFVHKGLPCVKASHPTLTMRDNGGNLGVNVTITCTNCTERRNMRDAMGESAERNLPRCRGRHPHLNQFTAGCPAELTTLIVGASNTWFSQVLNVIAVPPSGASALQAKVVELWDTLKSIADPNVLAFALDQVPALAGLRRWPRDLVWSTIETHRAQQTAGATATGPMDLHAPEWEAFTDRANHDPSDDFALRDSGVPDLLGDVFADVVQVERMREVRVLVGFTRLDAPDPEDPDLVTVAPLSRDKPSWLPASEVRGEGIFVRVHEQLVAEWEARTESTMDAHHEAYRQFRRNRFSDRLPVDFDPDHARPATRYYALHTLSHLLIRAIALECGYSSASLSERVYTGNADEPNAGILIYTAVPDADGTLGGLVSLAEPDRFTAIVRRALGDAMRCSSDPLCAERMPQRGDDFLHGAACHVCLFLSETTCERGNRFLDRRLVVPVGDPKLALLANAIPGLDMW